MKKRRLYWVLTMLLVFSSSAFSQNGPAMGAAPEADADGRKEAGSGWSGEGTRGTADAAVPAAKTPAGPRTITDITINGLKHTRKSYMMQVLKKFKGMSTDELDLGDVETALHAQEIFSEVSVRVEDGAAGTGGTGGTDGAAGPILVIDVKEKISFIPLPFFAVSDAGPMGGLFVMDTNASGMKNTYVLGGIISHDFLMGISAYSKPSLSLTQPGFTISASGFKGESQFTDRHKEEVLRYDSYGFTAGAGLTDKLTEHSSASVGFRYQFRNIDSSNGYAELEDLRALAFSAAFGQQYHDWNGWFMSQKNASLSVEYDYCFGMRDFQKVGADALFQHPVLIDRLRLLVHAGAQKIYHPHPTIMMPASTVGITILPADFNTDYLLGATGGFEFAFAKLKWMTLSAYGLYEVVRAEEWNNEFFVNQGFSAGAKMYLSKIAFPAMAFGFSYNLTEKAGRASFSLGVGL